MDKRKIRTAMTEFGNAVHITEENIEFWYARDLMELLGYGQWRNFERVIQKAMDSCNNAEITVIDHFAEVSKMVMIGSGAKRQVRDYMLTRYTCYLIAMNGDTDKEEIAFAQSYFAVQTRKQELVEERIAYIERTQVRGRLKESEKRLSQNIYERGVDDRGFARIRSKGDQALFGGYSTKEMKTKLGVKDNRPLADFLPTLTIAAKNLATEMTNYNVEEKDLQGENAITTEHIQNNTGIRQMLGERGIRPEELPPAEDIKKLERRINCKIRSLLKSQEVLEKIIAGISKCLEFLETAENRRNILQKLKEGKISSGDLANSLNMTPQALSYHLSKLKKADLIYETNLKILFIMN